MLTYGDPFLGREYLKLPLFLGLCCLLKVTQTGSSGKHRVELNSLPLAPQPNTKLFGFTILYHVVIDLFYSMLFWSPLPMHRVDLN